MVMWASFFSSKIMRMTVIKTYKREWHYNETRADNSLSSLQKLKSRIILGHLHSETEATDLKCMSMLSPIRLH